MVFFYLFFQLALSLPPQTSHPTLLLPTLPPQTQLKTIISFSPGRYTHTSPSQYLSLNPLSNHDLEVSYTSQHELFTYIFTQDTISQEYLKIETKIAPISKIQIITKLRSIEIHDIQLLEIQAYDKYGNVFSSIEGLSFQWEVNGPLEVIPFKKSQIEPGSIRRSLEDKGHQSDWILVQGLKTGEGTVSVKMLGMNDQVAFRIVERFQILPGWVRMSRESSIQFELEVFKVEGIEKQILPRKEFIWLASDSLVHVEQNGLANSGNQLGATKIIINDTRIQDNYQEVEIEIVDPVELRFNVGESELQKETIFDQNWNLIQNRVYQIKIDILDNQQREIYFSNDFQIEVCFFNQFQYDSKNIQSISQNKQYLQIKASQPIESIKISTKLLKKNNQILFKQQIFSIISPIEFLDQSQFIHLPMIKSQSYNIDIIGGSGIYIFQIDNSNVVSLQSNNQIRPINIGQTVNLLNQVVYVRDQKNQKNMISQNIFISEVQSINFEEKIKELFTDSHQFGLISAKGLVQGKLQRYNSCDQILFDFPNDKIIVKNQSFSHQLVDSILNQFIFSKKLDQKNFINDIKNQEQKFLKHKYSHYCGIYQIHSNNIPGQYSIKTKYKYLTSELNLQVMEKPQTKVPQQLNVLLAFGSTIEWNVEKGPKQQVFKIRWNDRKQQQSILIYEENKQVEKHQLQIQNVSSFQNKITCNFQNDLTKKFYYKLQYNNQNEADEALQMPLVFQLELTVRCEMPKYVQVEIIDSKFMRRNLIHLKNQEEYQIIAQPFSAQNERFYAYDGLQFQSKFESQIQFEKHVSNHQARIVFSEVVGQAQINFSTYKFQNGVTFEPLSDNISVFVNHQMILESHLKLIYLSDKKMNINKINYGSENFKLESNFLFIEGIIQKKDLILTTKKQGKTTLIIQDQLQLKSQDIILELDIQPIDSIKISIEQNLYEINSNISLETEVITHQGDLFPMYQQQFMNLQLSDSLNSLKLTYQSQGNFQGRADKLGDFKITVESGRVISNVIEINVYKPLTANFNQVNLAIGCMTFVQFNGGPNQNQMQNIYFRKKYNIKAESTVESTKFIKVIQEEHDQIQIIALKNGQTTISYRFKQQDQFLHQFDLKVIVENIQRIEIQDTFTLNIGATKRIQPIIKLSNNYLSPSFCQIKIEGSSPDSLVSLNSQQQDQVYSDLGVFVKGMIEGETQVLLKVTNTQKGENFGKKYEAQTMLRIFRPLSISMGSYFNSDPYYNLNLIIPINTVISPIIFKNSDIQLIEGNLKVEKNSFFASQEGNSSIILRHGNESKVYNIQTAQVESLILNDRQSLINMARNSISKNRISFLDVNGQIFSYGMEASNLVILNLNRQIADIMIDEDYLVIKALKEGITYVEISDNRNTMRDTFFIQVKGEISPSLIHVHIGNFSQSGGTIQIIGHQVQKQNTWQSKNPQVFLIQPEGFGQALKIGNTKVFFSEEQDIIKDIQVLQVSDIHFTGDKFIFSDEKTHSLEFQLFSGNTPINQLSDFNNINNHLAFSCSSKLNFVKAKSGIQYKNNKQIPYCQIEIVRELADNLQNYQKINILTELVSDTIDFSYKKNQEINFEWGIFIYSDDVIQINSKESKKSITIFSQSKLILDCENENIQLYNYGNKYQLQLDFTGVKSETNITCQLMNNQNQYKKFVIQYKLQDEQNFKLNFYDFVQMIIALFIILLCYQLFQKMGGSSLQDISRISVARHGIISQDDQKVRGVQRNLNLLKNFQQEQ